MYTTLDNYCYDPDISTIMRKEREREREERERPSPSGSRSIYDNNVIYSVNFVGMARHVVH